MDREQNSPCQKLFFSRLREEINLSEQIKNFCNKVEFGDNYQTVTRDGTVFPLMQENNLFRWQGNFINHETQEKDENFRYSSKKKQCLASSNLKFWLGTLGLIIFQDLIKLQDHVDGMQFDKNDSIVLKCDTCELNKARRKPDAKDSVDRRNIALDIVHVDILGQVTPVDNHRYALSCLTVFPDMEKFNL